MNDIVLAMHTEFPADYSVSGTCYYDQSTCSLVARLQIPNDIHTDLDYFNVDLLTDSSDKLNSTRVKVPDDHTGAVTTSFYVTPDVDPTVGIYLNVTAFDKCGTETDRPSRINCSSSTGNL